MSIVWFKECMRKNKSKILKVGQINNSLKLKVRRLKRRVISRFQLLIIYIYKNIMINKNNKGRGKGKYGYPTSIVLKKVAGMGVVMGMLAVGLLWDARGVEAARSKTN